MGKVSKTGLTESVKRFAAGAVDAALAERPDLKDVRDDRGRTWLHLAAAQPLGPDPARGPASIATAKVLLAHGLDIDDAAFTEGEWRATPLWYAISRGRNLPLARFLLGEGCNPDFCIFAACWNDDVEAIRLLRSFGAPLSPTAFIEGIGWSRFTGAEELLAHGADVNAPGGDGRTALHMLLKKDSPIAAMRMLARHGARGDIPGPDGRTAIEILRRKKDPAYRALADALASGD